MGRYRLAVAGALLFAAAIPAGANAAELVGRNANNIKLQISPDGQQALVAYKQHGADHRTLAWGAINAIAPTQSRKQVELKLDYSGGYKSMHLKKGDFHGSCTRYDGPKLHWVVAACKASDGSYWALQNWQRALPNYGVAPNTFNAQYELWLSHWKGALRVLGVSGGWAAARGGAPAPPKVNSIWGRFTYLGKPVYGFGTSHQGAPT